MWKTFGCHKFVSRVRVLYHGRVFYYFWWFLVIFIITNWKFKLCKSLVMLLSIMKTTCAAVIIIICSAVIILSCTAHPKKFAGALTIWYFTSFCNLSWVFTLISYISWFSFKVRAFSLQTISYIPKLSNMQQCLYLLSSILTLQNSVNVVLRGGAVTRSISKGFANNMQHVIIFEWLL